MDKASDSESGDCRFESCQGRRLFLTLRNEVQQETTSPMLLARNPAWIPDKIVLRNCPARTNSAAIVDDSRHQLAMPGNEGIRWSKEHGLALPPDAKQ